VAKRRPKPSTDKAASDELFRRIVRSRGECQRCHETGWGGGFQTAHVVRRRYSAVRCLEDNAWCLCPPCHQTVDSRQDQFMDLVDSTIGRDRYVELSLLAQAGPPVSYALWWRGERERLTERCKELGIDTRGRAA